ncbi:beta-ketoacyl-[acyl-carrier-protein] synthase family protein [Burkholderia glumae]|uniref:beta-ketoacyl-[acyl-carrier-protein] synthase family protein n=1 Tax=Burkholderia glumae TaxID=337 RepID=UPI0003A45FCC|nr:beta-ketoacyl-[acyl-carrier-protein] synthase family protein [Burkholderia glumae]MCM2493801.1 beta-ketoacyl-[acyl-carrier-protein] synthase family protein [Burkholderia glumae]MCM2546992.1 beta-ketoacyl-[acyl-carrier-protein] synthase family protein [Burkholderia glumae]MCR1768191.1 beta-ketoacyl-[acyl-carrier-protein] synthase family protein [Burkholderia glumae]QHP92751.1 beta-ketoacyl-[acyl-carrier-protein] synthase family protein [Burkholderia glumae]QKM50282.1 3-oxoacyl-[acyl-carrier-
MKLRSDAIVISAFGAVTPLGGSYEELHAALREGRSGIRRIEKFDCSTYTTEHAGVPDEGNERVRWPSARRVGTEQLYGELAAARLLAQAPFVARDYAPERIGCLVGVDAPATDVQSALELVDKLKDEKSRDALIRVLVSHMRMSEFVSGDATAVFGAIHRHIPFSGCALAHVGLCSASLQAIGMGMLALRQGRIDAAIVGGVSGKVNPLNLARLESLDVISTDLKLDPRHRSRPFDTRRSGFVLAEGAVLFLIERESAVRARGDTPLGRVAGYGASLAAEHIVIPHLQSLEMRLAMQRALADAGCAPGDIDYVNAHGTSTVLNDKHESEAIRAIFPMQPRIPVTANKSQHGHLIATAGAMEVLNTVIGLRERFIPATINLDEQAQECPVNVVRAPMPSHARRVLKNSFGMGGLAASLVLEGAAA